MYSLFIKEISSFFHSLTGTIVIVVFLLINSLFMWVFEGQMNLIDGGYATLDPLFALAPWVFLVLIPAITMRSLAEEKKAGTLDLLLTRPVSEMQIILAKYFAAIVLIVLSLLPTLVYYYSIVHLGNPLGNLDRGGIWGSYIGLLFLASAYAGIGIWCSSLTENLIVSFILAVMTGLFVCYGLEQISTLVSTGGIGKFILSLSIIEHYRSMSRGVIDTRDVVYFIALITVFLVLTRARLEGRKW
ncbi:MAG: gliding motility-associated ABC transporter permease subunit GldF [Bacteroidales bacterium]|nr:gliding motility-associated ABC transporter permease subunit GldF [Bacteroidales bacterium]